MSYKVVTIETKLTGIRGQIAAAKSNGTYVGNEQQWDNLVGKALEDECHLGERNVHLNGELIESQRNLAKGVMDTVEAVLKKKVLADLDYKMIEESPRQVGQCLSRISDDLEDLMRANLQYRGGWPPSARELLSPPRKAIVEPYVAARAKQIDGQAAVMAKKKRCEEYVQRATEFVKQAAQRKGQGKVEIESFQKDVSEIKNSMVTGKTAISDLHAKKNMAIGGIKKLEASKTWTPDQTKSAKSWLGEVVANAKNARGNLKTLAVQFEGLEKRGKAAGPGWKEMAAKAVEDAKKPYKEAVEASKKFDTDEEKCKKICKDHGVTV